MIVERVESPLARERFLAFPSPNPLPRDALERHAPDASLLASDAHGAARCSLWWSHVPRHDEGRLGFVGHYAATGDAAAGAVLAHALEELRKRGATLAIGPIDGTTWRNYRLVTDPGQLPPFFLEPQNPAEWPRQFERAGFRPWARYVSYLGETLDRQDPRLKERSRRLLSAGIRIRALETDGLEKELDRLYQLSLQSFEGNLLYSPLGREEFLDLYRPLGPVLDPRLVLLAERGNELVGFNLVLPDLLENRRDGRAHTAIFKTLAVHPELRSQGLGSVLTAQGLEAARTAGYERAIAALMHETNTSRRISEHYGRPMRAYALFSRTLGGRAP